MHLLRSSRFVGTGLMSVSPEVSGANKQGQSSILRTSCTRCSRVEMINMSNLFRSDKPKLLL